jgi:hypothetical protein
VQSIDTLGFRVYRNLSRTSLMLRTGLCIILWEKGFYALSFDEGNKMGVLGSVAWLLLGLEDDSDELERQRGYRQETCLKGFVRKRRRPL